MPSAENKDHILKNLIVLAENTVNIVRLLDYLSQAELIGEIDIANVMNDGSHEGRSFKIYRTLAYNASDENYNKIIKCLIDSKHHIAADILKALPGYNPSSQLSRTQSDGSSSHDDFPLEWNMIDKITSILLEEPTLQDTWLRVSLKLISSAQIKYLSNKSQPFANLIIETLQFWIARNAQEATFNNLCKIMKDVNENHAASELQKQKNEIRECDKKE